MDFFGGGRLHLHCLLGLLSNRPRHLFFSKPISSLDSTLLPREPGFDEVKEPAGFD